MAGGKAAYKGRILILADRQCGSACEDFVMPFKDNHRATVLGDTTAGSSGQPYFLDFGNGMSVRVGAKREFFPDGEQFEGVGIAPDVPVAWTTGELRNGEDPVLKKARELALSRSREMENPSGSPGVIIDVWGDTLGARSFPQD